MTRHLAIVLAMMTLTSSAAACESVAQVAERETVIFACPDNPLPKMQDQVPKAEPVAKKKATKKTRRHYRKRKGK